MSLLNRYGKPLLYLSVYVMPLSVALGIWLGGAFSWLTAAIAFVIVPLLDLLLGEDRSDYTPQEEQRLQRSRYYPLLTRLFVPVHYLTLAWALHQAARGHWSLLEFAGNVLALGIEGGVLIVVAHELGHKPGRLDRWLAKALLHGVCYGHFTIAHNRGHHASVATQADPATSRLGESFYRFLPRTLWGNFIEAWRLEARHLDRQGLGPWHWRNEMYRNLLYPLLLLTGLYLGAQALAGYHAALVVGSVFLAQAVLGFILLEAVNYLEHYGLERRVQADGRPERIRRAHSWNSNHLLSNGLLFHLQRHSDHHAWPARPYQLLHAEAYAPQLPTGYSGMILLALLPPLWFRIMDPLVHRYRMADEGNGADHVQTTVPEPPDSFAG